MASSDSKSQKVLPMLQPLNVKPGPPIYVEEAQVHVPGQKRGSTLRLVLLGLVFTFVSVLLCRYIFTLTSPYSCNKGGGMAHVAAIKCETWSAYIR